MCAGLWLCCFPPSPPASPRGARTRPPSCPAVIRPSSAKGRLSFQPVGDGLAPPAVSPPAVVRLRRRRGGSPTRPLAFGSVSFYAEGFALRGESLCPRRQRDQNAAGGPILDTCASLSGAGGATTDSAPAPLPLFLQNQDGLTGWTKRTRLITQSLIAAGETRRAADRRPYQAISVM